MMRIAGRLSVQADCPGAGLNRALMAFHGADVVVRHLSESTFEAELADELPSGALVRLRLPGAGMLVARVTRSLPGELVADFVNPVPAARLGKTLGLTRALVAA